MPPAASHALLAELIRHESFVRTILTGLLADEEAVQDAVQDTWLKVLRRPPEGLRDPRTWLARVARNRALSSRRSDLRRARREEARGAAAETATPEQSLERVETRQRVVAALLELDEPYRSVVLLRYEQDLATREIGRRLGRSEATVRSQLSRAHAILRDKLDREFGDRRQWALLAAPLGAPPLWLSPAVPAACAVAAAAGGAWLVYSVFFTAPPAAAPALPSGVLAAAPAEEVELAAPQDPPDTPSATRAAVDPAAAAAQDTAVERKLPAVVLRDRSYYEDYEEATFSFEHGLRDDPGLTYTRNNWGLQFAQDEFDVRMVVDDQSVIANLGRIRPQALEGERLDAGVRFRESAPVRQGNTYYVGTRDRDTDLASFVYVLEHEGGRTCTLDWYTTDGSGRAQGSLADDGRGTPMIELLARLRRLSRADRWLAEPRVVLQARAVGGNRKSINMAGEADAYFDAVVSAPLDVSSAPDRDEDDRAYFEGGWIPEDTVFVATHVRYQLTVDEPLRSARVVVGGEELWSARPLERSIDETWTGHLELRSGDEADTLLEVAGAVAAEVVIEGHFVPGEPPADFGGRNAGFFRTPPATEVAPVYAQLSRPRALLQIRAATGSCRVDLRGKASRRIDRVVDRPLDLEAPFGPRDESLAHVEAGLLPAGRAFVVTRVRYRAAAGREARGRWELEVVLGGEVLAELDDSEQPVDVVWTGRATLYPGEESRTYLEVGGPATGEVVLEGHFEDL